MSWFLAPGHRVEIAEGPLKGLSGRITYRIGAQLVVDIPVDGNRVVPIEICASKVVSLETAGKFYLHDLQ